MTKKMKLDIAGLLEKLLSPDEYTVEKSKKDGVIYKINPTNIGHKRGKTATIEQINQTIINGMTEGLKRKPYRKREELPDPSKPANDPVNLRRKPVSLRCEPELTDAMNRAADADGLNRNDWINVAIREKLKREHPELVADSEDEPEPDPI